MSLPFGLHREVDALLGEYLAQKRTNRDHFPSGAFFRSSSTDSFTTDDGSFEQQESQTSTSAVMERILRRRSLQLRDQQQAWLVVPTSVHFRMPLLSFSFPPPTPSHSFCVKTLCLLFFSDLVIFNQRAFVLMILFRTILQFYPLYNTFF